MSIGSRLTEFLAQIDDRVERLDGKVDAAVEASHVWQLYPQSFVHRREMQQRIRRHAILVQGAACSGQPVIPCWPPKCVVRPIHSDIYNNKNNGEIKVEENRIGDHFSLSSKVTLNFFFLKLILIKLSKCDASIINFEEC